MSFGSNVAPPRRVREKPTSWRCNCPAEDMWNSATLRGLTEAGLLKSALAEEFACQPYYLARCPDCGTKRP